jgi:hypothetical protein
MPGGASRPQALKKAYNFKRLIAQCSDQWRERGPIHDPPSCAASGDPHGIAP